MSLVSPVKALENLSRHVAVGLGVDIMLKGLKLTRVGKSVGLSLSKVNAYLGPVKGIEFDSRNRNLFLICQDK